MKTGGDVNERVKPESGPGEQQDVRLHPEALVHAEEQFVAQRQIRQGVKHAEVDDLGDEKCVGKPLRVLRLDARTGRCKVLVYILRGMMLRTFRSRGTCGV